MGQFSFRALWFPLMLHSHISFIYHVLCLTLALGSVIKRSVSLPHFHQAPSVIRNWIGKRKPIYDSLFTSTITFKHKTMQAV
jgi:hypothetical protein